MKPSTRRLCEAEKSVRYPVSQLDVARFRADFADLMDECANAVTMEHGLDLDDVLMERFAVVVDLDAGESDSFEVPIPFLTNQSGVIQSIQNCQAAEGADRPTPERLEIRKLVVRVFLESGSPLFNQAGNAGTKAD